MSKNWQDIEEKLDQIRQMMHSEDDHQDDRPLVLTESDRVWKVEDNPRGGTLPANVAPSKPSFGQFSRQFDRKLSDALSQKMPKALDHWLETNLDGILEKRLDRELDFLFRQDD